MRPHPNAWKLTRLAAGIGSLIAVVTLATPSRAIADPPSGAAGRTSRSNRAVSIARPGYSAPRSDRRDGARWQDGAENIVWQTGADNIVWQTDVDNIVWQTDADNIVWQTDADNIVWQTDGGDLLWDGSGGEAQSMNDLIESNGAVVER